MSDATLFSDYEKAKKELSVLQKNEPSIHTNIEIVAIELTIKAPELIKSESLLMREAQTLSSRDDLEKNTKKSAVLSPLKKL